MIVMDYIFIGVGILFAIIGLLLGFGKQLKILTSGIFGIIISIVVCYFIFGFVLNLGFVQTLLESFREKVAASDNGFMRFLLTIRIDVIALAIVLFLIVQIVRIIIVAIIKGVMEANNPVLKVINRTLGLLLGVAVFLALMLIVMQIIYLSQGTDGEIYAKLEGSFFRLDRIYLNNPLNAVKGLWSK